MRRLSVCLMLALASGCAAAGPTVALNTGHRQRITALRYDAAAGLLFSASEGGLVVAWDPQARRPLSRLQVSRMPVSHLAVHPSLPQLAVVEGDRAATRLAVWDYQEERRLYSIDLETPPSSVTYSSAGTYLVVCRERYDSLLFLDPQTGRRIPAFGDGFGIVSLVTFNADDTVMMSYQAGGDVRYWNVAGGARQFLAMTTEPLMQPVALTGSADSPKDSLVGASGRSLVVADIVRNGAVRGRAPLSDVLAVASTDRGEIVTLSRGEGGAMLGQWRYLAGSGLVPLDARLLGGASWVGGTPVVLALGPGESFVGCSDGTIVAVPPYGESRVFSRSEIADVSDVAVSGEELIVAVPGGVIRFRVDAGASPWTARSRVAAVFSDGVSIPLPGSLRLAESPEGEVWAWSADGESGELLLVGAAAAGSPERLEFPGPLKSVAWSGRELCVVERSGRCSILVRDAGSGAFTEVFEYVCLGGNTLAATPRAVVMGKSSLQRGDSSLLFVDRRTGETVAPPSDDEVVYELQYEAETDTLLAIGVGMARTSLTRLSGGQYFERKLLLRYEGEDTGGDIVREGNEAYTSLGYTVTRIEPGASLEEESTRAPRRLALGFGLVACVNQDGSVGLWSAEDLKPLADLYIFRDGEWIVLVGGRPFAMSAGGSRHVATRAEAATRR